MKQLRRATIQSERFYNVFLTAKSKGYDTVHSYTARFKLDSQLEWTPDSEQAFEFSRAVSKTRGLLSPSRKAINSTLIRMLPEASLCGPRIMHCRNIRLRCVPFDSLMMDVLRYSTSFDHYSNQEEGTRFTPHSS